MRKTFKGGVIILKISKQPNKALSERPMRPRHKTAVIITVIITIANTAGALARW